MRRKLLVLVVFIAVIAVGWYFARQHLSLETISRQEARLRAALADYPLRSFLVGLLAYVVLTFVPPTAGKALVFGWLFGLWQGIVIVNVGLTFAAIVMFLISRYLLRDRLRARRGAYLMRLDAAIDRDGAFYLFALRMMHAPYTFLNYALGATALRTGSFWWATQLGMLPGNALFVYAGTRMPTLQEAAEEGLSSVASPQLIGAFVLVGVFPLIARWAIRRLWPRVEKSGPVANDDEN
jgi:uncharacterized membrane protein YdjX (TVP38/TMEM64 family)